jgi:hypothetical protein
MEEEKKEKNIFNQIETTETPSGQVKDALFTEIEIIQNAGHILDLFLDKFIKVGLEAFSPEKKH